MYLFIMISSISITCPVRWFYLWGIRKGLFTGDSGICALVSSNSITPPFSIVFFPPSVFNTYCPFHLTYPVTYVSFLSSLLDCGDLMPGHCKTRIQFIASPMTYCSLASNDCLPFFGLNNSFCLKDQKLILVFEVLIFD